MFAEDPAVFLADFGVPCIGPTPGLVPFVGMLDQPDVIAQLQDVSAHSRSYELLYTTAAITLKRGDALTVNTIPFSVREAPRQLGDGLFSTCLLTKP